MLAKSKQVKKREPKVLFWQVALGTVFIVDNVEYNKFSARRAVSTTGKVVTFKDSDAVKLKNK